MSNSRTSKVSKAYDEIKNLFAEIAGAANAATYERVTVGEAYARINDALAQIDDIVDSSLSKASPVVEETITLSGNEPHLWVGIKW